MLTCCFGVFTEYFSCIHKNFKVTFVKKISDTMLITGILLYCPEYGLSKDADLSQLRSQAFTPFVICSTNFTQVSQCLCHLQYKIHPGFSVSASFAVQTSSRLLSVCVICSTNFTQASQCLRHLQYKLHQASQCLRHLQYKIHPGFCIASNKYCKGLGKRLHSTPITHRQSYDAGFSHFSRLFMFCASLSIGKLETKRGLEMRLRALWKTFMQIITGTGDHC